MAFGTQTQSVLLPSCVSPLRHLVLQGGIDIVSAVLVVLQKVKHAVRPAQSATSDKPRLSRSRISLLKSAFAILLLFLSYMHCGPQFDPLQFQTHEPSRFQMSLHWMSESYIPQDWKTYSASEQAFVQRVKEIC